MTTSDVGVASPHSILHSTALLTLAGFVLTGDRPTVTRTEALAARVGVEGLTRHDVPAVELAAALSQGHTASLHGTDDK